MDSVADLTSEIGYGESFTCSLASTRMSPNQTCDDLPGPGRLIDTHIYQPAGRYLERRIYNFRGSRKPRISTRQARLESIKEQSTDEPKHSKTKPIMDVTFHVIKSFFAPLWKTDGHVCRHAYWGRSGRTVVPLDLSDYLLICCGARQSESSDIVPLIAHCEYIMSLVM